MGYECIVLAKQVADARNITGEAMKADGTVNRSALPAIFNPEDLNSLEMGGRDGEPFGAARDFQSRGPEFAGDGAAGAG